MHKYKQNTLAQRYSKYNFGVCDSICAEMQLHKHNKQIHKDTQIRAAIRQLGRVAMPVEAQPSLEREPLQRSAV